MAPRPFADRGHDWGAPNLDGLGILYIGLAVLYTVIVFFGLFLLWQHRREPAVKMRGFFMIVSVVLVLHFYAAFVLVVYPINGLFKCWMEFWTMSIVLPFGIALFQALNVRLLSYYRAQQYLADLSVLQRPKFKVPMSWKQFRVMWKDFDFLERTYTGIILGLFVQVIVTSFLFLGSRKFHSSYGIFSTYGDAVACRHGYEWIPSVVWQLIWSCMFGPYVLFRTKGINDTHYWAFQTRLAIIAAVPGSPLWLTFLYSHSDSLQNINRWFVPAGWFLPGLMTMQAVSIVFPLLDIRRSSRLSNYEKTAAHSCTWSHESSTTKDNYSMASLELQLERNIEPLLKWTAERDFTAENVLFLKAVRDLRLRWRPIVSQDKLNAQNLKNMYKESAMIFFTLVNPQTAPFNINIDYRTYNELAEMFKSVEYQSSDNSSERSSTSDSDNAVTPWLSAAPPSQSLADDFFKLESQTRFSYGNYISTNDRSMSPFPLRAPNGLQVPANFSLAAFDRAYEIVKQDVFRNTWLRYEAMFGKPRASADFQAGRPGAKKHHDWGKPWKSIKRVTSQAFSL